MKPKKITIKKQKYKDDLTSLPLCVFAFNFLFSFRRFLPIALIFLFSTISADVPYTTIFEGVEQEKIRTTLNTVSQLQQLEEFPPQSLAALRKRAEADLPNLMQGLQSLGYYNPTVSFHFNTVEQPIQVIVNIDPGEKFKLRSLKIITAENKPSTYPLAEITAEQIGLPLGRTAYPYRILEAENKLLSLLAMSGYPLVEVLKREVLANKEERSIDLVFTINTGEQLRFGKITLQGLENLDENVILKKIQWFEGEIFDPRLVDKTQEELEDIALFQSVIISHSDQPAEDGMLPILIEIRMAKPRTVSLGFSYTTQLGPGAVFGWENRNMRNRGERLSLDIECNCLLQNAAVSYTIYDFMQPNQDLLFVTEVQQEHTKGFTEKFFSFSALFERQINDNLDFSYGLTFKQLISKDSDDNGTFSLIKLPLQLRWSNANHLLDPTWGLSFNYKAIPTQNLNEGGFNYLIQTLTTCAYKPLTNDQRLVLAGKITLGSIIGAGRHTIPPPERFYAGSENCLRGYRYLTVSPLSKINGDPIGGRSLLVTSLELRSRWSDSWGGILFWDAGSVSKQTLPPFCRVVRQSVGAGIRYFTPVGPLRLDIAFPLNRRRRFNDRKHYLDNIVQVYFSVGQSF